MRRSVDPGTSGGSQLITRVLLALLSATLCALSNGQPPLPAAPAAPSNAPALLSYSGGFVMISTDDADKLNHW